MFHKTGEATEKEQSPNVSVVSPGQPASYMYFMLSEDYS